jgi:galactose mutarotase-like enzyme
MTGEWSLPRVQTDFSYRGIDALFLENAALRILLLPGKGGDILEFRDKRADVDVLYHTDHNWQPPDRRRVPTADRTAWHDTYPGGWQVNLPLAGYADGFEGTPYGLHGESALLEWDAEVVRDDAEAVSVRLRTELVRYPLAIERELTLPAGESTLHVAESVTNEGGVEVPYIWQQHLALGRPLVGPAARLDLPAQTGVLDPDPSQNARHPADEEFAWPEAPANDGGTVDFSRFPDTDAKIHDMAYATDLDSGWYAVTNTDLDLGFAFTFPTDPFECVWYWGAFGGCAGTPYFNRNYNLGLEPTTAYPGGDIPEAQRANGTLKTVEAGETLTAEFAATTYRGGGRVEAVTPAGEVRTD